MIPHYSQLIFKLDYKPFFYIGEKEFDIRDHIHPAYINPNSVVFTTMDNKFKKGEMYEIYLERSEEMPDLYYIKIHERQYLLLSFLIESGMLIDQATYRNLRIEEILNDE